MMEKKIDNRNFIAWFKEMWTGHPLFSTLIALLVMVVLQTIALGFDQGSFGDWLSMWCRNWLNILRKMIYAFEEYQRKDNSATDEADPEKERERKERIRAGMQLFVDYFEDLWI